MTERRGTERGRVRSLSLKEKLGLYLVAGLTAVVALLGSLAIPIFEPFHREVFGPFDQAWPLHIKLMHATAPFWLLVPFLLLLPFVWTRRGSAPPRQQHRVWWVAVSCCLLVMVLIIASFIGSLLSLEADPGV